ncbi:MAG TPA: penicillin-binding protein activator, partial [Rhodospirillales bacterium]|nr:penicillin-binding protein activator [Rhodospirillales bacterium]
PSSTVRVALLVPLRGPNRKLGQALLNAAQLALFEFSNDKFELLIHDTGGTPEGALEAARLAIGDGASLILGPLLASSIRAVAPVARAANITVIGFSSDRTVAGGDIYTMGFFPETEVRRLTRFARDQGITRFAALAPSNAYGQTVVETLRQQAERLGAVVTRVQFYDPDLEDFSGVVRDLADYDYRRNSLLAQRQELAARGDEISARALSRLARLQTLGDLPFEALLLADGGKRLLAIAALLPFYDVDPKKIRMLGTGQWDTQGLGAEPALLGGWYSSPPPDARADFVTRYEKIYGGPPHRLATLAYDATALAAVLSRSGTDDGGSKPDFSRAALTNASGFWGRDGIFRFLADGTVERGLAVMQIERRGKKVIDPAPTAFAAMAPIN